MDITIGHLLVLVGLLDLLWAILVGLRSSADLRSHGRGTPLYARARDSRRFAVIMVAAAVLLIAIGLLTPLREMSIT